jgi:hypothetical protein
MKTGQLTVIDLTNELKRLALGAAREARKESELECLSTLTSIRSITQLLIETLAGEITVVPASGSEVEPKTNPIGFHSPVAPAPAGDSN